MLRPFHQPLGARGGEYSSLQSIVSYIHTDTLGSTVLITNQAGAVVQEYDYDPFGQITGQQGSNDTSDTNYLFTGQEYDTESDLYYYNARYYNPRTGRFISKDPILGRDGNSLTRNGYIYVLNNPLKYTDPTGNEEEGVFDSIINSDIAQGTAGFVVGVGEGLWSTVKTIGNVIAHPIDAVVGVVDTVEYTAIGTYDLVEDFCNNPDKTWNEVTTGLGIMYNEFFAQTTYEMWKDVGFTAEKVAEIALLTKGAGAAKSAVMTKIKPIGGLVDVSKANSVISIPQKAINTLRHIEKHGSPPNGYKGGKIFKNLDKNKGLPEGIWREYDIDPKIIGVDRNAERILIEQNTGQVWYTPDHYGSFKKIK